jgi:nucleoid DNA-binding protein
MTDARARTKAQLTSAVAQRANIEARDVNRVLEALAEVVLDDLSADGPGVVSFLGLVKAEVGPETARPARAGRHPATGAPITIAARPARERGKLKLRPLKRLRDVL